ncbi:hypothetical protein ACWT_0160 [Actinoplanes sp. SE50]|nr:MULTISPECIES: hypothetical protein [unclassified Actinoplanes]AEV81174.1 hypothetical protein ACPL_275 [Actinoplanes sp. SE50/110]ATO79575.1 hypothetical protein ACWT_0160 [Actinoplanes sp. SE50]SLL96976.1 hypothetical protein ACSP50_0172 [Actinoplanes sp. SE50/110]
MSITAPAADTYTVVADGYAVSSGSTAYDYRDVYYSKLPGLLTVLATR